MRIALLGFVLAALGIGGCATQETQSHPDLWSRYFQPMQKQLQYSPTQEVEVRAVTRDQIAGVNQEWKKYFDDRKLAPEDATVADARALRAIQLDAYRIREDPDRMTSLGVIDFWCVEPRGGPNDQELLALARRIGADTVVCASEHVGTVEGTAVVPVPTFEQGSAFATASNNRGGFGTASATGSSFGFQGQVVPRTYDKWETTGIFFRHITAEEREQLNAMKKPSPGTK